MGAMVVWSIASLLMFGSILCLLWAVVPDFGARRIRQRMYAEMPAESRPTLIGRLATALTPLINPIAKLMPSGVYAEQVRRLLESAGFRLPAAHFMVIQFLSMLAGMLVYGILFGFAKINFAWLAMFMAGGLIVPLWWLSNRRVMRRMTVSRDLPEVVDLLSLCVDAGLDFMNALTRIVREFRRCPTTEELGIVIQEVRVGKRRRDALRAFSSRMRMSEASSFSRTLIQADRMGTGISEALLILSEDMRVQRSHWADRFAQQAPLKMLIPLLMSLGAAMVIVAGPIMVKFLLGGFGLPKFSP